MTDRLKDIELRIVDMSIQDDCWGYQAKYMRINEHDIDWLIAEVKRLRDIMAQSLHSGCTKECVAEVGRT